ncbi:hypothetical protein GCM10017673_55700 [Streptosporangium violaceochromogenes]|nr:hypothetical protein GCM10017673_55700 [Streptosporangium violaceochromogenes]
MARIEAGERPVRLNEAHLIARILGTDLETMTSAATSDRELRHAVDQLRSSSAEAAAKVEETLSRWLEAVEPFTGKESERLSQQADADPVARWGLAWAFKALEAHDNLVDAWKALQAISGEGPELHPETEYEELLLAPEIHDALSAWRERYGLQQGIARAARSNPRELYAAFSEALAQNPPDSQE